MSYYTGTTGGPMNASFALAPQDVSWVQYANRADFSHNPWFERGPEPPTAWSVQGGWGWGGRMQAGDPTQPGYVLGCDVGAFARWGDFACFSNGVGRVKIIKGQVVDQNNNPVSGATVQLFLTSSNGLVSTVGGDSLGNYAAPTPYDAQQHYALASGTGVAGGTVNTLTPTNVDGT